MTSLSKEKHPDQGPVTLSQLQALVARATKEDFKSKPKLQRDMRKEALRAQLFWYGVEYTDRMLLPTLEKLLRQAVEGNKCDQQAPRIIEHERRKQEDIRTKNEKWQKATTPGERACADIDRFMEQYFITKGIPDRSKTTEPLALHGYSNCDELHDRLRHIDGLDFCLGGPDHTVSRFADTIGKNFEEETAEEQEDEWEEVMKDHRDFVASLKNKKPVKKGAITDREKLEKCKGSYVVRCEEISGEWDNCDSLGIDIATGPKSGILQATVEFGIIEGTMLLAFNQAELEAYVGTANNHGCTESEDEDDDDDDGSEDGSLLRVSAPKKRKAPAKNAVPKRGRGRPKKQAKTVASTNNRLHFRLRGRETGEGVVFHNPEKGYLDFTNNDFVAFKGIASLPAVGRKVPLEGFKVSLDATTQGDSWSAYSEEMYEEERVSRWH